MSNYTSVSPKKWKVRHHKKHKTTQKSSKSILGTIRPEMASIEYESSQPANRNININDVRRVEQQMSKFWLVNPHTSESSEHTLDIDFLQNKILDLRILLMILPVSNLFSEK